MEGLSTIVPGNPAEVSDEFLKDSGDKVVILHAKLERPHQQAGQEFLYLVAPFKLVKGLQWEQAGAGVFCQTEAEVKETCDNLMARFKRTLVVTQCAGGGSVGWATLVRRYCVEWVYFYGDMPGGKKSWVAVMRETDQDTLETKTIRQKETDSEGEARYWAGKWREEYVKKTPDYLNSGNLSLTPPPPARCNELTAADRQDLGNAKLKALQKQWPQCFKIFERRKANPGVKIADREMEDAYLLDRVRAGGEPALKAAAGDKVRADMQLIASLNKAGQNYAKRGKSKIIDAAIFLIAFKWELGWCYLSDEELAQRLGEVLETKFTAGQVKQFRYRTLGLVGKHQPGPAPKSE